MVRSSITRREAIAALGAVGAGGVAGCTGNGNGGNGNGGGVTDTPTDTGGMGASGTVKIGVLQPLSGAVKYYGQSATWAFYSGFAYKAGGASPVDATPGSQTVTVGDVDYELIMRDTQASPDVAQEAATELVENDEVDMLWGMNTAPALRVIETVSKPANVLTMLGSVPDTTVTANSKYCGDLIFRPFENSAMICRPSSRYMLENTDLSDVYMIGADYSWGRDVIRQHRTILEGEGGANILEERYVPRGYEEWQGILDDVEAQGADTFVHAFTVATSPPLIRAYLTGDYSFRVYGPGLATNVFQKVVGQLLQSVIGKPLTEYEEEVENLKLGPEAATYYWNQYDNPINDEFVDIYTEAYGLYPGAFAGGSFTAASALVQAVEETGSTEMADVASALSGMTVTETVKGENQYEFQEYNNHARSPMTISKLVPNENKENWAAAVRPSEPLATIPKDETTLPENDPQMDCSL